MNKKSKIIIIAIFILLAFLIIMRLKEDSWICEKGQWKKHGVPSGPMPEGKCDWRDSFNPFK